jgi:hypothetical protein
MKLVTIPEQPTLNPHGEAAVTLRYEDVAQDGRMLLETAGQGIGEAVWRQLLAHLPERDLFRTTGIIPILTRIRTVGGAGPFSVDARVDGRGTYAMGKHGDRIYVDMWASLTARHGRTYEPSPDRGGPPVVALRTFAEHVMTRLFAPPDQRRVSDVPGVAIGPRGFSLEDGATMLVPPPAAELLDGELVADSQPFVFGLRHTDSNQHVNSLVYPRLFEEAVVRRLAARGRSAVVLATEVDCAYRKPCFAGDVVRFWLQAFVLDGQPGAVGVLLPEGATPTTHKPHTFVRMLLA